MIGTLIAISFALCIIFFETKNLKQLLIIGFHIFIGFIAIQVISILYFYYHGALRDFWRIAFLFNFQYSSRTHSGTINSIVKGWRIIGNPFLFSIFMIGFVLLTTKIFMYSPKRNSFEKKPNLHSIKVLAMFMIPIEFLLTGISGRNFPHYYQTWLPSITLVSSYLIHQIKTINCEKRNASIWKNFALLPFIICITLLPPFVNLTRSVLRYQPQSTPKIVDYIKENTSEDDWVLTWGTHSLLRVLYQSHRVTPTRFTSQTSFVYPDYRTSEDIVHFCHEVALQTPELIIDDNDFSIEKEIADDPYFSCFTNFVRENYTHMGKFEDNILNPLYGMDIYKLNEKDIQ